MVDGAVAKAYRGKRKISWCPLYAGLEGLQRYGSEFPQETVDAIRHLKIAIKGPFTTPIGEETHVCLHCAHQQYHPGVCDQCGKEAKVPFAPTPGKPVYCSDCFGQKRGDRGPRRY